MDFVLRYFLWPDRFAEAVFQTLNSWTAIPSGFMKNLHIKDEILYRVTSWYD